jgi:hypothetical protein
MRMLTDRGSEYCGNPERHEYELYLAIEDIDHSRTKTKSHRVTFRLSTHCSHGRCGGMSAAGERRLFERRTEGQVLTNAVISLSAVSAGILCLAIITSSCQMPSTNAASRSHLRRQ